MFWWSKWWATRKMCQEPSVEEVRKGHHVCISVCERKKKAMCACYSLWCCLINRICRLTSALGQRAKVISLSQPKVSGKARNPSRGTVPPPPFHFYLINQILFLGSSGVFGLGPSSMLTDDPMLFACVDPRATSHARCYSCGSDVHFVISCFDSVSVS